MIKCLKIQKERGAEEWGIFIMSGMDRQYGM